MVPEVDRLLWVGRRHSNQRITDAYALATAGRDGRMVMPRSVINTVASGYAASASSTGADATLSRPRFDATGASPPVLSGDAAVAAMAAALGVAA